MSWDNLRRQTVLNRNDIFYFIYSILYRYILVSLWCIICLDILYPVSDNKASYKCQSKNTLYSNTELLMRSATCHGYVTVGRPLGPLHSAQTNIRYNIEYKYNIEYAINWLLGYFRHKCYRLRLRLMDYLHNSLVYTLMYFFFCQSDHKWMMLNTSVNGVSNILGALLEVVGNAFDPFAWSLHTLSKPLWVSLFCWTHTHLFGGFPLM